MVAASLIYLTSEEIWKLVDGNPFPEITIEGFVAYLIIFSIGLFLIHYVDTKEIGPNNALIVIAASIVSVLVDLFFISFSELIVLFVIQVLPQDLLKTAIMLLVGAMPISLGSVTLSSLTSEILKKHAQKLHEEVQDLVKQSTELKSQLKKSKERLELFEKRRQKFEEDFKKTNDN